VKPHHPTFRRLSALTTLLAVTAVGCYGCYPPRPPGSRGGGNSTDPLAMNNTVPTNSTSPFSLPADSSQDVGWGVPAGRPGADSQTPSYPAGVELVPLPIVLPAPAFRGTPVDKKLRNVEKPLGKPRPEQLAPLGTANLALGMPVWSSDPAPASGELDLITDGDKEATDFGCVKLSPGTQWVQVDLGDRATIYYVLFWHNHAQARVYDDVVVQVSDDPDFLDAHTVFNNDYDNTSGLDIGTNLGYYETSEGKLIDCKGIEGRYVRFYSRGNSLDGDNHYTEIEVYGMPAG